MLLALDTATPRVAVAVHDGERVLAERLADQPMRHGEQLAPAIVAVLQDAGVGRHDLTGILAGVGPGPFTGLRVGLVTALTLGAALGIEVRGVCSLDGFAARAIADATLPTSDGFLIATDARRREVYLAEYDADGRRTGGPWVSKPADVSTDRPVLGPGTALYPDLLGGERGPQQPSAGWLARCVVDGPAEALPTEPLYLRRPDATEPAVAR